jgi:glycosyltransferase involved in cell wall biosynthesis
MKAALYYPWIYLKSGSERTIAAILAHSRHDWTIYTNRYEREATFPELANANIVELSRVSVRRSVDRVVSAAWRIGRQRLPLDGERVLLVVCEGLGDFVTFRNRSIPVACLCLTPLRAAFDPHYQDGYVERHSRRRGRRWLLAGLSAAYRVVDRAAWRRYACALAISREVETRIRRGRLRPRSDKIEVACPGVDTRALVPSWRYDPYFLLPGRIMWTKNIQLGLAAFDILRRRRPDLSHMRLVVAGFVDEKSRPYLAELRRLADPIGNVEFVISPSDDCLFALYRDAYTVLCTPFNEDWGLVALEGMALGKPVVAVNRGGLRETVRHGEMGFLVTPTPECFADAVIALADSPDLTRRMGRRAHVLAQEFDTRRFVRQVDDRVEQLAEVAG